MEHPITPEDCLRIPAGVCKLINSNLKNKYYGVQVIESIIELYGKYWKIVRCCARSGEIESLCFSKKE